METHTYPHFPADVSTVHLALYSNVSNAPELRKRLVTASKLDGENGDQEREAVNYAFVDARLITSRLHIQTAVYQAILAHVQGSLRTKTVHSEVLWTLSPSHNISEAIKRFGVSDASTSLLVVRISPPSFTTRDFETKAGFAVKGGLTPLSSLEDVTDWPLIRKYYKLNADPAIRALGEREIRSDMTKSQARERELVDQLVISCIAMKSVSA